MKYRPFFKFLTASLFLFPGTATFLWGEDLKISDSSTEWTVRIPALESRDVSRENRYLLESLPLGLKKGLVEAREHRMTDEETAFIRTRLLETKILDEKKAISKLLGEIDEGLFQDELNLKTETDQRSKLKKRRESLVKLQAFPLGDVEVPETKSVRFESEDRLDSSLPSVTPAALEKAGVNLYLRGSLQEISGSFILVWEALGPGSGEPLWRFETLGYPGDLEQKIDEAASQLKTLVLGRSWAGLQVLVDPPLAGVTLDGEPRGAGTYASGVLHPGSHTIEVSALGFLSQRISVDLSGSEEKVLEVALVPDRLSPIAIQSFPSNARVYLGSEYQGDTPLIVDNALRNQVLTLSLDGFEKQHQFLIDDPMSLQISLKRLGLDREGYVREKRAAFYGSLAAFTLMVPVTLFSYGMGTDLQSLIDDENTDLLGKTDAHYLRNTTAILYDAGIPIIIGAFLLMTFDILEYIGATDQVTR